MGEQNTDFPCSDLPIPRAITTDLLESFFGIPIKHHTINLELKWTKGRQPKASLLDQNRNLEFPLNTRNSRIEVFSIFDVLVEYVGEKVL